jgi:hypothetical protein
MDRIFKRLHRRFPVAVLATVRTLGVVFFHPLVKVAQKLLNRGVDFLPECNFIKFALGCPVESFTDSIALRMSRFGLAMIDILYGKVQLVLMMFSRAAVFCSPVRQDPQKLYIVLLEEGNNTVI